MAAGNQNLKRKRKNKCGKIVLMKKGCFLLILFFALFTLFILRAQRENVNLASEKIVQEIEVQDGRFEPEETKAIFDNQPVTPPVKEMALRPERRVLSAVSPEEKWIEVDLTHQRIRAHEGNRAVYDFPISSGKPWTPTVTGEFRVWIKLKYAKMSGGSRELGNYYYLPNVPFIMYYYKGYGIHGAYWHNNFGHPMSHGCVNMRTPDAEKLFYWADPPTGPRQGTAWSTRSHPGTRVVVHGKTPWR